MEFRIKKSNPLSQKQHLSFKLKTVKSCSHKMMSCTTLALLDRTMELVPSGIQTMKPNKNKADIHCIGRIKTTMIQQPYNENLQSNNIVHNSREDNHRFHMQKHFCLDLPKHTEPNPTPLTIWWVNQCRYKTNKQQTSKHHFSLPIFHQQNQVLGILHFKHHFYLLPILDSKDNYTDTLTKPSLVFEKLHRSPLRYRV